MEFLGRLIGQGFNILNDKSTPSQIMKYETITTDYGIVIPSCAKFEKVLETRSFMDQFDDEGEYVQSRLTKLNVVLMLSMVCSTWNQELDSTKVKMPAVDLHCLSIPTSTKSACLK